MNGSSGCASAKRRTASTTWSTVVAARTSGPASSTPPQSGCTCPSPKPGSSAPPSRSTTSAARGARSSASWSRATTRPARTASARARVPTASSVSTVPPRTTRSTPLTAVLPSLPASAAGGMGSWCAAGSRLDVAHHVLDPGVVLEAVHRQVLAVARVLEAAVRHLGDQRDVGVDPDAAEVQGAGHAHGPDVVLGPDRGREPVLDPVGPAQRLALVGEPLDGDDRPEDLVLDQLVVLPQAGDDRRLVEVAPGQVPADPVPAGTDRGVLGRTGQQTHDAVELVGVVERAEQHVLVVGQAGLGVLGLLHQSGDRVVVDAGAGEHPGGRGA